MIIYKLTFKTSDQASGEKLFTTEAVKGGKLREELGRIFGWSGYASSAEEEDDAQHDRRLMSVFETMLTTMAHNKIPDTTIVHKDRSVSLACMEVA